MIHPPPPALDTSDLHPMLWAESVAVVGASPRTGSLGRQVMAELLDGGFEGRVIPITPTHDEVAGLVALDSIRDLTEPVDLVILAVADSRLEEQTALAVAAGARGLTVFSPSQGQAADGSPLRSRLAAMAVESGIPLCGPNGMGFVNVEHRLRATGFYQPRDLRPGGITFLSHSGSLFSAMLHNRRGLFFNLVVSSGQEIVTTMDEYLVHAARLPSTNVIGLFLETIRRPKAMARALTAAAERDIPVVALKVGRTERARAAAATHSGALAGEDAAYDAFFDLHGVHRVDTMDEMADTLEVFSHRHRARRGGLGAVLDSGGERTLLIDVAHRAGVGLAPLAPATRDRLAACLEDGLEPDNPVDAWGTGHGHDDIFGEVIRALADDPAVGVVAFCVDLTTEAEIDDGYLSVIKRAAADLPVPLVVLSNLAAGIDPTQAAEVRALGVPVLEGTRSGLVALGHLLDRTRRHLARSVPPSPPEASLRQAWRDRLGEGRPLSEAEGLALIADYGIPAVGHRAANDPAAAVAAAEALGYPVAVKTAHAGHKTDVDGVRLDINGADAVHAAYADLAARLGPEVIVEAMAPPGIEVALGIVHDPQFGPLVMVGAGGVLVELLSDSALAFPPLDAAGADRLVSRLAISPLLAGVRGSSPADRSSLNDAIARLSVLAADLGDLIAGVDINPVIVAPTGAVAVDALVVPHA